GIGTGAGIATSATIVALASNPVGWAALGGLAVGIIFSNLTDLAYQNNFLGIKDKTDWVGHKIDDGIDAVKKSTEKAVDSFENAVGEATKGIS
ncbi:transposase, partial [Staphylococcus aureus]|nr:transposase [Staphylococcus aureus]